MGRGPSVGVWDEAPVARDRRPPSAGVAGRAGNLEAKAPAPASAAHERSVNDQHRGMTRHRQGRLAMTSR